MAMTQKEDNASCPSVQEALLDDPDFLREIVQQVCQDLLDTELDCFLEAGPYERTPARKGYRNGRRARTLKTRVGSVELMVPRDREGRFQTELFARYQRSEKALVLTLQQMVLKGVSTRKVREITERLCGTEFSKSQASRLTQELDEGLSSWRRRSLKGSYRYLIVDTHVEHVRQDHEVFSQGVLIVMGVRETGHREILAVDVGLTENETFWSDLFKELHRRGLRGVQLVVSDDHQGLVAAIRRYFQGCQWQRCQVHFLRNLIAMVPRKRRRALASALKDLFGAPDRTQALARLEALVSFYEKRYPKIADKLETEAEQTLTCFNFPESHRRRIRTTNALERLHRELRRRTRVVGIFPNPESCLRLTTALAQEQSEQWLSGRRYLDMSPLKQDQPEEDKENYDEIINPEMAVTVSSSG
jgi:transposase-like protein